MKKKDYSFKTECRSPKSLWGIFRVRNARGVKQTKEYEEDPRTLRTAFSGMTTLLNKSPLTLPSPSWRGNTTNPLPPGGGRGPVRADEGEKLFPSPLAGEGGRRPGEGLAFASPRVEGVARSADGGSCVNNTPLPRFAVLSPQGGQRTARSFFTRPSSPRSVGMRGIGAARGFTLIELLVVILIIAILAAIALPQYQKAVWRSRNTQLKTVLNSLIKAQELYYLTNGTYANNFADLDIGLPLAKNNDDPCRLTHVGTDAIRSTEDYYAVLNNASTKKIYVLSVVWKKGPYKCAGFSYVFEGTSKPRQLECQEARHSGYNLKGAFCETLEKGVSSYDWGSWAHYPLP